MNGVMLGELAGVQPVFPHGAVFQKEQAIPQVIDDGDVLPRVLLKAITLAGEVTHPINQRPDDALHGRPWVRLASVARILASQPLYEDKFLMDLPIKGQQFVNMAALNAGFHSVFCSKIFWFCDPKYLK
jgi:hypothetical protein